jgi:hypothetical protein
MRKILLASTALVALTSVSAMAADVTISGSASLIYKNDDKQEATTGGDLASASSMSSETDVNISFSNTTDSGITATLNAGFDEGSNTDDATATISGDFGAIKIIPSSGGTDHNYVVSYDEKADKAGEGSAGSSFGLGGATGESIGYQFPSIVDGLTLAVQHSNEDTSESFGYGASFNAGIATIGYGKMSTNTTDYTSVNVSGTLAGVGFGLEQNKQEAGASKDEATLMGVSYTMDSLTLAYETGSAKNESGDLDDYKQIAISYAVAPGITTVITSSEVNQIDTTDGAADVEEMEIQLKLSF